RCHRGAGGRRRADRPGDVPSAAGATLTHSVRRRFMTQGSRGDAPIEVVPYRPEWPAMFEAERAVLDTALAPWLVGPIEHIGSTAVPGLVAKPLIDIMASVESLEASLPAIDRLAEVGYCYA